VGGKAQGTVPLTVQTTLCKQHCAHTLCNKTLHITLLEDCAEVCHNTLCNTLRNTLHNTLRNTLRSTLRNTLHGRLHERVRTRTSVFLMIEMLRRGMQHIWRVTTTGSMGISCTPGTVSLVLKCKGSQYLIATLEVPWCNLMRGNT
jgi:hypothetical protein